MKELIDTRLKAMDQANELLAVGIDSKLQSLKEILLGEVARSSAVSVERYEGIKLIFNDHALALDVALTSQKEVAAKESRNLQDALSGLREILQGDTRSVQDVSREKFEAIEGTFASNALALTAALAAQKEAAAEQNKSNTLAITKSENATKETIAANAAQNQASALAQADTIADLKDRLVRLESGGVAAATERGEIRANRASVGLDENATFYAQSQRKSQASLYISIAVGLFTLIGVIVAIAVAFHK
jgi:hypothetical protein